MRVGAETVDLLHPYVCAEVYPLAFLSLEACGNGAGFLHQGTSGDMAHFRLRGTVLSKHWERFSADLLFSAGFAEIQRGEDEPGFLFGKAKSPDQIEGAGPEFSISVKGQYWFDKRAFLVADLNAGAASIPSAPIVMQRGSPVIPYAGLSVGLGF